MRNNILYTYLLIEKVSACNIIVFAYFAYCRPIVRLGLYYFSVGKIDGPIGLYGSG